MQNNSGQGGNQSSNNQQGSQVPKQSGLSWSQPATTGNKPFSAPGTHNKSTPPLTPKLAPKSGSKKLLGIVASGVLVGFLLGWAWFASRPAPTEEGAVVTNEQNTTTGGTPAQNASTGATNTTVSGRTTAAAAVAYAPGVSAATEDFVTVPTPQAPGTHVLVSGLKVSVPTWIVVYDNNNGVRGNALGAALFFPTTPNSAVNISLLRGTVAGKNYLVGRNVDNGNKIYSLQEDGPVVDSTNKPVYQTFEVRN